MDEGAAMTTPFGQFFRTSDSLGAALTRLIDARVDTALAAAAARAAYTPTPEEELRERVAKAMYEDLGRKAKMPSPWEDAGEHSTKPHYRDMAEAAIKAMRDEPA